MNKREVEDKGVISVIIPVYNVKNYLSISVKSVLMQSYNNLEIILVDDGSTDGSGEMCDEFALIDNRIIVIHKENGGLSDARNVALDRIRGNYIFFLDSDDCIHLDTLDILINALTITEKDIAVSSLKAIESFDEADINKNVESLTEYRVLSAKKALESIPVAAWGKLYRASLWKNVRFPVGRFHEDEFVFHKIIWQVNGVVVVDCPLYFYFQREGSIMHLNNLKKSMDAMDAYKDRLFFLKDKGWNDTLNQEVWRYAGYVVALYRNRSLPKRFRKDMYAFWKKSIHDLNLQEHLVMEIRLFYYSPICYALYEIYKRVTVAIYVFYREKIKNVK